VLAVKALNAQLRETVVNPFKAPAATDYQKTSGENLENSLGFVFSSFILHHLVCFGILLK